MTIFVAILITAWITLFVGVFIGALWMHLRQDNYNVTTRDLRNQHSNQNDDSVGPIADIVS